MSFLDLSLKTPLELVAEDFLLVGEVDDTLLHPRELRRQELLELGTVRIYQRIGPEEHKHYELNNFHSFYVCADNYEVVKITLWRSID